MPRSWSLNIINSSVSGTSARRDQYKMSLEHLVGPESKGGPKKKKKWVRWKEEVLFIGKWKQTGAPSQRQNQGQFKQQNRILMDCNL